MPNWKEELDNKIFTDFGLSTAVRTKGVRHGLKQFIETEVIEKMVEEAMPYIHPAYQQDFKATLKRHKWLKE